MAKMVAASRGNRITKRTIEDERRVLSVFDAAEEGKDKELHAMLMDNPGLVYKTQESGLASALHLAARAGHTECVDWLLDYKAPPNKQDQGSSTPLHFAAEHNHVDIVKLLLDFGADKAITNFYRLGYDEYRDTPRDVAVYYKRDAVVDVLDNYVPSPRKPGDKQKAWQEAEDARIAALEAEADAAAAAAAAGPGKAPAAASSGAAKGPQSGKTTGPARGGSTGGRGASRGGGSGRGSGR